jgi:hypothetical protein
MKFISPSQETYYKSRKETITKVIEYKNMDDVTLLIDDKYIDHWLIRLTGKVDRFGIPYAEMHVHERTEIASIEK